MTAEVVADLACHCAESPLWHDGDKCIYFTDNETPHLYRFDPATNEASRILNGDRAVGAITLHQDGRLQLFMTSGTIALWEPGGAMEVLLQGIEGEEDSRFNDVLVDPAGRVYCGTMPVGERQGRLYRWDPDGSLHLMFGQAGLPNGMGFSPDYKWLYLTDTHARTIFRCSYDPHQGALGKREPLVVLPEGGGDPDGLVVDQDGCLWSALFFGGALAQFDPNGKELQRYELASVNNPTCPVFAGEGSSVMYLTTAGGPDRPESGVAAGSLLRLTASGRGGPVHRSRSL